MLASITYLALCFAATYGNGVPDKLADTEAPIPFLILTMIRLSTMIQLCSGCIHRTDRDYPLISYLQANSAFFRQ